MRPLLETEPRPDTREARVAGDRALRVALALGVALIAVASVDAAGGFEHPAPPMPARSLPFVSTFPPSDGAFWQGGIVAAGKLRVTTGAENGAVATVRGGDTWRDYALRTRVRWVSGQAIALHVHETAPDEFAACVLDGTTARIDVVSHGVARTLALGPAPSYAGHAFDAVAVVRGRDIGFAVDGATLVTATLPADGRGTAGIAVWDPVWGHAALEAEYVRVEPASAVLRGERLTGPEPVAEDVDRGE
jgi:hypothetical protein